jgi:hypothetical protein
MSRGRAFIRCECFLKFLRLSSILAKACVSVKVMSNSVVSVVVIKFVLLGLISGIAVALLLAPKPWGHPELDGIGDYVRVYSWWAGLINLVLLTCLTLTVRWWARPLPAREGPKTSLRLPKGFSLCLGGAMATCAIVGFPRLDQSLWEDEEYSVRRCIVGGHRVENDGTVERKNLPWRNTLWNYSSTTNHILQSVLARLSHSAWRTIARPGGLQFSEAAVRLPSYLAGILVVGTVGLLMARFGLPWEGALAAWLIAIHPWHLRFATEARGYGMVALLIPVGCLLALNALDRGQWRWWIALALANFALLYTWPPTLFTVVILNLCIAISLLTERRFSSLRDVLVLRWLVASIFGGMLFLQLFLPCVPGLFDYLKGVRDFDGHLFWLKNVGTLFLTGSLWSRSGQAITPYMEYLPIANAHPIPFCFAIVVAVALFTLGIVRLWIVEPRARWVVAVLIFPGVLTYAYALFQKKMLMEWYVGFMLQGVAIVVASGAFWAFSPLRRFPFARWAGPSLAIVMLIAFAALSNPARQFLLTFGAERYRESVLATRPNLDPNAPENMKIITAATTQPPYVYDPRVRRASTIEEYAALMKEADERGVPLYVNNGFPTALKIDFPGVFAMLEDSAAFEPVAYFTGIDVMLDRSVVRYRPNGLKRTDLERYKRIEAAHQSSRMANQ